jgi:hypothetical protein
MAQSGPTFDVASVKRHNVVVIDHVELPTED